MSYQSIDHVGIAVSDLSAAYALYRDGLGMVELARERMEVSGLELIFFGAAADPFAASVELLVPLHDRSTISDFLAKNGPGIHHICYRVTDIKAELARCKAAGMTLIDQIPRPGARGAQIAFVHPRSFSGVLTEFCQY